MLAVGGVAVGADWPAYGQGPERRGSTSEALAAPLRPQWTHAGGGTPRPAWPEPVREVHMMGFDYAPQVVSAGGAVYFGSTADHTVYALDLATGRERWRFVTDGPARFAPAVWRGKVYVAGDDGWLYCLSAAKGELKWRVRGGPRDERLLGNGQMISRWPLRSGVVVADGVAYFTAGMWPTEGVYRYAVDAETGRVKWKTESTRGFAPQGYLTAGPGYLVAPTGRCPGWVIDRADGKGRKANGYVWAISAGEIVFSGTKPRNANEGLPIAGGAPYPPKSQAIISWLSKPKPKPKRKPKPKEPEPKDGKPKEGKAEGGTPKDGQPKGGKSEGPKPKAALKGKHAAALTDDVLYAIGAGKLTAQDMVTWRPRWEVPVGRAHAVVVAGEGVVVGGDGVVTLLSTADGRQLWAGKVDGEARGLAVADGRLLVSTHTGQITCFGPGKPARSAAGAAAPSPREGSRSPAAVRARKILSDTGVTAGHAFLAGVGDGRLAAALAEQSKLTVHCMAPDAKKVAAARRRLAAAGLYGARVTVHQGSLKKLPYPDYFADLVILDETLTADRQAVSPAELYRLLRPCGGKAVLGGDATSAAAMRTALAAAGVPAGEIRSGPNGLQVVRGRLPGAGQWTHLYADAGKSGSSGDTRVAWPVKLLWFGEPGPGPMMNRHWRGTAPLCVGGRMFVLGQHSIMAVDAYNGRPLWSRPMPAIQRRVVDIRGGSMAADAESLYIATADLCLRLDSRTGQTRQVYRLPLKRPRLSLASPQTIKVGENASIQLRKTARALEVVLTAKDTKITNADRANRPTAGDSWELFFDFRPPGLAAAEYGPGAFQAIIVPATVESPAATWHKGLWSDCPGLDIAGKADPTGSRTTVRIPWVTIRSLTGGDPAAFTFGAILNASDDGKTLTGRTYTFANAASYRLANGQATIVLDPKGAAAPPAGRTVEVGVPHESLTWGRLVVVGDLILGTMVVRTDSPPALTWGVDYSSQGDDYTGPPVDKVLAKLGLAPGSKWVFALGKDDGKLRWVHHAERVVPHNAMTVGPGRVYLIDQSIEVVGEEAKRRGETATGTSKLVALALTSGRPVWQIDHDYRDRAGLRLGGGVLLATGMRKMTVLSPDDGRELWSVTTNQSRHHCGAYLRAPVVAGGWVYDEPHAYDLRTGRPRNVPTASGPGSPWRWGGFRGCGTVSASEKMLFFRGRDGKVGLLDAAGTTGVHSFGGIRPGCYINIITAGGLVLIPEGSSGCACGFNFQTTVAMMPVPPAPAVEEAH